MDYLRLRGAFAWRNNTGVARLTGKGGKTRPVFYGSVGSPDVLAIMQGRFIGVECKSAKGKQSDTQAAWQAECERAGGVYVLARDVDDVAKAIDRVAAKG